MQNLENIKVGDKLYIGSSYLHEGVYRVDRVTKTQVMVGTLRFRKRDGYQVGGYAIARLATSEDEKRMVAEKRYNTLLAAVRKIDFRRCSSDQLEKIIEIANPQLKNTLPIND